MSTFLSQGFIRETAPAKWCSQDRCLFSQIRCRRVFLVVGSGCLGCRCLSVSSENVEKSTWRDKQGQTPEGLVKKDRTEEIQTAAWAWPGLALEVGGLGMGVETCSKPVVL